MATFKDHHKRLSGGGISYQRMKVMFQAVEKGNVPLIELLLKEGGLRINSRSPTSDKTLLQVAVFRGRCISVIRRLVHAGCRINSADSTGDTALHTAVRYHKIHVAAELIRLGADVRAKNNDGETPLQLAVSNKSNVDVLLEMIPNGDKHSETDFYGLESLRLATSEWRQRDWIPRLVASLQDEPMYGAELRELVKMILDAGADVNAKDINDCSPVQCAVYTGDLELVKILIDAGANLDNQNSTGATALHDAVLCCNEAMVHLLLSRGANVDIKVEHHDHTAMHWALQLNTDNSHEGVIRRLMEFGSDLDREDVTTETPLQYILKCGDINLVTLSIQEHKADLNKLQSDGSNLLSFAAQNIDERVLDLVLQKSAGLQIDQRCDEAQLTPLHHASRMSLLGNVRQLISRGADVNAKDGLGRTPLFHCIFEMKMLEDEPELASAFFRANYAEERRQVLRFLLESGADVNIFAVAHEEDVQSILELAIFLNDIEAWLMIIEYAAEVEARTNELILDAHNLQVLKQNPGIECYYQRCRAELTAMKTTKIEGSLIAYFSVFTEKLDVLARYTRNEELVNSFQLALESDAYPIYGSKLQNKFDAAIARQKKIEKVSTVLSETLQFADPTDVAFEKIFQCLTEADVELLIGSAAVF